jgi:hypothetical protein
VAVNCCVPEEVKPTVGGLRDTVTAWSIVTAAVATIDGFAMVAAVIITVLLVGALLGAT